MYPSVTISLMGRRKECPSPARGLPADFLDVVVLRDAEHVSSAQSAASENLPPVSSRHPRAKSVHADTPAYLGLVCPFGHHIFLSNDNVIHCVLRKSPNQPSTGRRLVALSHFRSAQMITMGWLQGMIIPHASHTVKLEQREPSAGGWVFRRQTSSPAGRHPHDRSLPAPHPQPQRR